MITSILYFIIHNHPTIKFSTHKNNLKIGKKISREESLLINSKQVLLSKKLVISNKNIELILDNTSLPLLVQMYCFRLMAPTSSPYAVFRASDWNSVVAQPIGLRGCLRIAPKKFSPRGVITKQRGRTSSRKTLLGTHVQLAFA